MSSPALFADAVEATQAEAGPEAPATTWRIASSSPFETGGPQGARLSRDQDDAVLLVAFRGAAGPHDAAAASQVEPAMRQAAAVDAEAVALRQRLATETARRDKVRSAVEALVARQREMKTQSEDVDAWVEDPARAARKAATFKAESEALDSQLTVGRRVLDTAERQVSSITAALVRVEGEASRRAAHALVDDLLRQRTAIVRELSEAAGPVLTRLAQVDLALTIAARSRNPRAN